jgi:hypothetical protein
MSLLFPQISWKAWAPPDTVVVSTSYEGAFLAVDRLVGVGTARHCGGGHDSWERSSGFYKLSRNWVIQPLCWRARQVRALVWHLFSLSSWAQPTTVVASTTVKGADLAALLSVGVGSASHCGGGHVR